MGKHLAEDVDTNLISRTVSFGTHKLSPVRWEFSDRLETINTETMRLRSFFVFFLKVTFDEDEFDIIIVKAFNEVVLETLRPNSDIRLASVPAENRILVMSACIVSCVSHDGELTC